ncbi:unnamed protein product [Soboliphyme baturini]|uniref:Dihydroorotate dehydrogenase (quinone), mitochondrial n=1 Tax=Soboliphyme baturini TaxID=241478 RepID=A0A183IKV0_9BILA|nr:unnamed protein product [Soboliphyme baturini]
MFRKYPELEVKFFDMTLDNPIGLAAGFDKDAEAVSGLTKAGFGFVEVGTVTPLPQVGNPQPRIFRLTEDHAVINRCGFNNAGYEHVAENLRRFWASSSLSKVSRNGISTAVCVGVSLGKNRDSTDFVSDYCSGLEKFDSLADYFVLNVSSPNTYGLRNLQYKKDLQVLLKAAAKVRAANPVLQQKPVLLKVSPDLTEAEKKDIAALCLDKRSSIDGLIISNTTISRPATLRSGLSGELGGLSGAPLKYLALQCVRDFYRLTKGKVPIIGCGGIESGKDAYDFIKAGASLVQLYTAIVYNGFPVVGTVKRELSELLKQDGFSRVEDAVGTYSKGP